MFQVDFIATEYIKGSVELDFDDLNADEAKELAAKEVARLYPEYDNIEILDIKEVE